jgi:3-hydroxyisobutyrate dehydrogenase-like beta-hydroxyacid dehydrogenase
MKTIAVIGLGIMGHGIADNYLKHGYTVVVWNRSAEKAADLIEKGAVSAGSVKEAVQQADLVFEVTANDESSREMWLADDGILQNAKPEQVVITCATLSIEWTDELAAKCAEAGLIFLDMPMTGGRVAAEGGQLTLLVGGDKAKLDEVSHDLEPVTKDVKYFGKAGSGMRYKLILNTLQAIHIAGLGEALRMADVAGLDKELVGSALVERPGGVITNIGWEAYQQDPNPITFSVEWINKDLGYAAEMTDSIEHPLLNEARRLYERAIEQGYSQADWTKINKL